MWRHPKYYEELKKIRRLHEARIKQQASSDKQQAVKDQASSDKRQAPKDSSTMEQESQPEE